MPPRGDSEQGIKDALERLEARLTAKIDRLAEQLADAEAEAEEIMRRATAPATPSSPRRRARPPRRRGDTFLRVVKAAAIAAVSLGIIIAAMAPVRAHRERFTPPCNVLCSRPVAHHSRPANRG